MAEYLPCPACGGDRLYYTPHNDLKFCFHCGHTERNGQGKLPVRYYDIPAIRQIYTELAHWYHSCLDTPQLEYLTRRGVSEQEVKEYKIGYVPPYAHVLYQSITAQEAGIATAQYKPFLAERIVFPYWVEGICTDMRGRAVGDHSIRYLACKGGGYYRGADYPYNYCALSADTVVITEGELKCIAGNKVYPCGSLPGIMSMRPQLRQRTDQTFVVCFDSQIQNTLQVHSAIHRLASMFINLKVATLPLKGKEKQDIDSFILDYGKEAYQVVIDRALPYTTWKELIQI